MYDDSAMIMLLNTLTPTHPGSGTQLSYVDLPIQREGHTDYPKIEAATLKGCIRYAMRNKEGSEDPVISQLFGPRDKGEFASAVAFSDARMLFFPVKSVIGIFAWATCPFVLNRFLNDYRIAFGRELAPDWKSDVDIVRVADKNTCKLVRQLGGETKIMLEEYTYKVETSEKFANVLNKIRGKLPDNSIRKECFLDYAVLLPDDDFVNYAKYSTEVNTRIKISSSTGTVEGKGLFTEEFLPPECIMYCLVMFEKEHLPERGEDALPMTKSEVKEKFIDLFQENVFQIGSDRTLGKGLVRKTFWEVK